MGRSATISCLKIIACGSDSAEKSDLEGAEVLLSRQSSLVLGFLIGSGSALWLFFCFASALGIEGFDVLLFH